MLADLAGADIRAGIALDLRIDPHIGTATGSTGQAHGSGNIADMAMHDIALLAQHVRQLLRFTALPTSQPPLGDATGIRGDVAVNKPATQTPHLATR